MSKMKHLLRKLHIGNNNNNSTDHQNRLGQNNHTSSSNSVADGGGGGGGGGTSSSISTTSSVSSTNSTLPTTRNDVNLGNNTNNTVDFNFFEEEFQVQLALAISASDPDGKFRGGGGGGGGGEDIELDHQIKAAQRISLGVLPCGGVSNVPVLETPVDILSLRYWNYNVVNYDEKVVDGFYDVYGTSFSSTQGKMPLLVDLQAVSTSDNIDYGVILVDRCIDPALQQLERRAFSLSMECQTSESDPIASGLVQKIADLVVETMGGPVADADEMIRRWIDRSYDLRRTLNTIVLPLGCFDIGLSRHRALLFKVLADRINLPCRLVKGSYYTGTDEGAVNLIKIGYECEYIIDLMGAPGALIPAELPSNLEDSRADAIGHATAVETARDSFLALDMIDLHSEDKSGILGAAEVGGSESNEASGVGNHLVGKDVSPVQKQQTEVFEHEFGKLLPSLRKPRDGVSGTKGKASSAQKMKVKDVSKYVISAAQNPEFAQKLHAVLLESGASPPPDLFSDIAPLGEAEEQKVHAHTPFAEGEAMDTKDRSGKQKEDGAVHSYSPFTDNSGFRSSEHRYAGDTDTDNQGVSCQNHKDSALHIGGAQCCHGNAGRIVKTMETVETISSQDCQKCNAGAMLRHMETESHDLHMAVSSQNEWNSPVMDEVAEWEIPWEDIQTGERIGLGSYGEVYHADWNGTEVAVKKFLDQDLCGDALEQFRCEVRIMLRLRHPNVVLFMGAVTRPPNLSILTEFLPRGSLYRLLHRPNIHLDEKRRLRMALDVAKGMNYLHTSHPTIVHRDLKSPNLLVDKNWVVKVADFGLSRLKHHTYLSSKSTAGTPEWMAPEVLRNEPSNEKCDVYSFGVILWELTTLRMPWSGMNPMQVVGAVGFQNRRLEIPKEVDPAVAKIICDCWQNDPNLRPSFAQLMVLLKRQQRLIVEKS
ncbi:probable serine/threonine-protein kinase SIS8 [Papaver somniferum]|uniref:probable serine/threonine-protein kinase SIS8 n=1 Tax=Papaver somniferum TaxID=3469 RepID=UPI000E702826|nr:probable serine/threonine-protein kinase SIS8 [Papaver somniferum]